MKNGIVNQKSRKLSDMQHVSMNKEPLQHEKGRASYGGSIKSGVSTKISDRKSSYHDSPEENKCQAPYQNGDDTYFHEIDSSSP